MKNSGLSKIDQAGENHVEKWLVENGYSNISKVSLQANKEGLTATGRMEHILVQVQTFINPHRPYKLSDFEIDLLVRRAAKLESIAYAAYVVLDDAGTLAEEITWERLS